MHVNHLYFSFGVLEGKRISVAVKTRQSFQDGNATSVGKELIELSVFATPQSSSKSTIVGLGF